MSDCRSCAFNTYQNIKNCAWVSCNHPATIAKTPRPAPGDPAWVNMLTGDVPLSRIDELQDCATFQSVVTVLEGHRDDGP